MAEGYITLPVETDATAIKDIGVEYLEVNIDGIELADGNQETWMLEAVARMAAEVRDVASDVPKAIFRYFGNSVMNLPPVDDVPASCTATVTMVDNSGYTLAAGTVFALTDSVGVSYAFEVVEDVEVEAGDTASAAGAVTMVALLDGADANGLSGTFVPVDDVAFVASLVTVTDTDLGTDAETDDEYLDRLADEMQLLTPRPVLPADFAVLARRITGVERAVAIDGYNPNHNFLTTEQASLEGGTTTGWAAVTNCAIANSATTAADGVKSLRLSSTGSGDMKASTPTGTSGEVVEPYQNYTFRAEVKSGASARSCKVGIGWYDSGGSLIGAIEYGTPVTSSTSGFTLLSLTADAPATAAYAAAFVYVTATGAGSELHYFDKMRFSLGSSTSYQPGGVAAEDNEKTITVALMDENGDPVSSGIKTTVEETLEAYREINFQVFTTDADQTTVPVTYVGTALPDFDAADVKTDVDEAITDYLTSSNWGLPADGTGQERSWTNRTKVRLYELATVINNVDGFDELDSLLINGLAADMTLPGRVPLPTPGTITGTVTDA